MLCVDPVIGKKDLGTAQYRKHSWGFIGKEQSRGGEGMVGG